MNKYWVFFRWKGEWVDVSSEYGYLLYKRMGYLVARGKENA